MHDEHKPTTEARDDSLLDSQAHTREDERPDATFYEQPRMVAHIDDHAIAEVRRIYGNLLSPLGPEARVLDLMSSRYSHLPDDLHVAEVVGLGMNADELAENPQLTSSIVHDLNADPQLPFDDASFDAVLVTVSVQYLVHPVAVFRDVARILRPSGPLAVTFSDRMFPTKAVRAWRERDDSGHIALVQAYFAASHTFGDPEVLARPGAPRRVPWGAGSDPIYAVIARRLPVTP